MARKRWRQQAAPTALNYQHFCAVNVYTSSFRFLDFIICYMHRSKMVDCYDYSQLYLIFQFECMHYAKPRCICVLEYANTSHFHPKNMSVVLKPCSYFSGWQCENKCNYHILFLSCIVTEIYDVAHRILSGYSPPRNTIINRNKWRKNWLYAYVEYHMCQASRATIEFNFFKFQLG